MEKSASLVHQCRTLSNETPAAPVQHLQVLLLDGLR
jgi:hypothetical protein